jgi:cellulose 1,4-beta-cellobiosidase
LEGVTAAGYTNTYGITSTGSEVTLQFVTFGTSGKNVGSRVYLKDTASTYQTFYLKNKEFAFDVDVSRLPCGVNGAVYFVEMDADGGKARFGGNSAGAKFGTGYCDAQCPHDIKFINGEANLNGWTTSGPSAGKGQYGSCCNELDIWEANSISSVYTPHPCTVTGQTRCTGTDCGDGADRYNGVCDKDGCDSNPYRMGNRTFYGPGKLIDTGKPLTVVTQFITFDNTDSGDLVEIKRFFKQGSTILENPTSTFTGLEWANSITDDMCSASRALFNVTNEFGIKGGLKKMGEAMGRGLVLAMSLWDDADSNLLWLDSNLPADGNPNTPGVARGTCSVCSGTPLDVETNSPFATVKYGNIKYGTLGTTSGVPAPNPSLVAYSDAVMAPFQDWSWATHNAATSTPVAYSGLYSYSFIPSGYNAAYFYCAGCISTSTRTKIEFHITGWSNAITGGVRFALLQGSTSAVMVGPQLDVTAYTSGTIPAYTWAKGTVMLNTFPSGTYDGFWFQESAGVTLPTVYVDNIRVV